MIAYPFASEALVAETELLLGQPIATQECALLKQIVEAQAQKNGFATAYEALGGSPIGDQEVTLLKQLLVLVATS